MIKAKRRLQLEAAFLFVRRSVLLGASALMRRSWTRPFRPLRCFDHRHSSAVGCATSECADIKILPAEHVDAEMLGRSALAVKRVDAAARAEEMLRAIGAPDISRQKIHAAENREFALMDLGHERILSTAQRAVATSSTRQSRYRFGTSPRAAVPGSPIASHVSRP